MPAQTSEKLFFPFCLIKRWSTRTSDDLEKNQHKQNTENQSSFRQASSVNKNLIWVDIVPNKYL